MKGLMVTNLRTDEQFRLREGETLTDGLRRIGVEGDEGWILQPPSENVGIERLSPEQLLSGQVRAAAAALQAVIEEAANAGLIVTVEVVRNQSYAAYRPMVSAKVMREL